MNGHSHSGPTDYGKHVKLRIHHDLIRLADVLLQLGEGHLGAGQKFQKAASADLWDQRPGSGRRQGRGIKGAELTPGQRQCPEGALSL